MVLRKKKKKRFTEMITTLGQSYRLFFQDLVLLLIKTLIQQCITPFPGKFEELAKTCL